MAYLISEEANDLLQDVREFCENEVKEQCKEFDRSGEWPKEIYDKAIEMQLHSLEVPEEYGGPGLSRVDVAALIEEMAIADAGFATTISASGLGTKPVLIAGNEEQKSMSVIRSSRADSEHSALLSLEQVPMQEQVQQLQ